MQAKTPTKADTTRQLLIDVGARLFHQQGYHNTGLQQILREAAVAKGSFYFHFTDKQSFALAVIAYHHGVFNDTLSHHLTNEALDAEQKLSAFHQFFLNIFEQNQFSGGCPIGNLSQEMADVSAPLSDKLNSAFSGMSLCFRTVIIEGQAQGLFNAELDSSHTADFMVNSWEGAVLRMKSVKNAEPLENWYRFMQRLLQPQDSNKN